MTVPIRALFSLAFLVLQGLALGVLLVAILGGCAGPVRVDNPPRASMPAVARLQLIIGGHLAGHCTAWKAASDRIVTAGHCCEKRFTYALADGAAIPGSTARILVDDDLHDICVMEGKMRGARIPLALSDPEIGEYVWTAGYPRGNLRISGGYWSGRDTDDTGLATYVSGPGESGAPVMNADGYAVGVHIAGYPEADNSPFIAPLEWLRADLAAARGM